MPKSQNLLKHMIVAIPLAIAAFYPSAATAQTAPTKLSPNGCLSGYPNGTFQGDRPLTRYEFAAGMNACLDQVKQPLEFDKASFATRTDFDTVIQRQRELNEQLRELSDRVGTISGDEAPAK